MAHFPLDKQLELTSEILYLLQKVEMQYGVRVTDIKLIKVDSKPPKIVGLELEIEELK